MLTVDKTGAIDDIHRAILAIPDDGYDEDKRKRGKTVLEKLGQLKYELQHNRQLT